MPTAKPSLSTEPAVSTEPSVPAETTEMVAPGHLKAMAKMSKTMKVAKSTFVHVHIAVTRPVMVPACAGINVCTATVAVPSIVESIIRRVITTNPGHICVIFGTDVGATR